MLRSLTDQLRIYLHPACVVVAHERRWPKRRVLSLQVRHLDQQENAREWHGLIALLHEMLAQGQYRGLPAKAVLSSHLLRYRIAPWHAQLTEREQVNLLKHQFEEIHGAQAAGWEVSLSNSGFGKHELACAVEMELIAALKLAFKQHQVRLLGIQPAVAAAVNHWRRQLRLAAWLLIVEDGIATLAGLSSHGWESIRTQAAIAGSIEPSQLVLMLERESLHAGSAMTDANVSLFRPDHSMPSGIVLDQPVAVLALKGMAGFSPALHADAAWAMV